LKCCTLFPVGELFSI